MPRIGSLACIQLLLFSASFLCTDAASACLANGNSTGRCVTTENCDFQLYDAIPNTSVCGSGGSCCYTRPFPLKSVNCEMTSHSWSISRQVEHVITALHEYWRSGHASEIFRIRYCCDALRIEKQDLTPLVGLSFKYLIMTPFWSVVISLVLFQLKTVFQRCTSHCKAYRMFAVSNLVLRQWPARATKHLKALAVPDLVTEGWVYLLTPQMVKGILEHPESRLLPQDHGEAERILYRLLEIWRRQKTEPPMRMWQLEGSERSALVELQRLYRCITLRVVTVDRAVERMQSADEESELLRFLRLHHKNDISREHARKAAAFITELPIVFGDDEEVALLALQKKGQAASADVYVAVSRELRSDKKFLLRAVKESSGIFEFAPPELRKDKELALHSLQRPSRMFEFCSDDLRGDPAVALVAVIHSPVALEHASPDLQNNKDIVLSAVMHDGSALRFASEAMKNDRDVGFAAVQNSSSAIKYCGEELLGSKQFLIDVFSIPELSEGETIRTMSFLPQKCEYLADAEVMLAAVKSDLSGDAMKYVAPTLAEDKSFVLSAVTIRGMSLQYASGILRADRDIVLAAVRNKGFAMKFASDSLVSDRIFVEEVCKHASDEAFFEFASEKLQNDDDFVLNIVKQNGLSIRFASDRCRNNPRIALAAVQQNGKALEFVSNEMRRDHTIVLAAVQNKGVALLYADESLRGDASIVLAALSTHCRADSTVLTYASLDLRCEKEFMLAAIQVSGSNVTAASRELQNDSDVAKAALTAPRYPCARFLRFSPDLLKIREFALAATKADSFSYTRLPEELRRDKEIALAAVSQHFTAMADLPDSLARDRDVIVAALRKNADGLRDVPVEWRDDIDVVRDCVARSGEALQFASLRLRNDVSVVMKAVRQQGKALRFASSSLQADPDVAQAAVLQDGIALACASAERQADKAIVMFAVEQSPEAIRFAAPLIQADSDVCNIYTRKLLTIAKSKTKLPEVDWNITENHLKVRGESVMSIASAEQKKSKAFVLNMVESDPRALIQAQDFQSDFDAVLAAVRQDGKLLYHAAPSLKNDRRIVLAAVQTDRRALESASEELRRDKEVVMEAVKCFGESLQYASQELRGDRDVALAAIASSERAFTMSSSDLKDDRSFILDAVRRNGRVYGSIVQSAIRFASDREVVMTALLQDGRALAAIHNPDPEMISLGLKNGASLRELRTEIRKTSDKNIVLLGVRRDPTVFPLTKFRSDIEVVLAALRIDGTQLKNVEADLANSSKAVVLTSVIQNASSWTLIASSALQEDEDVLLASGRPRSKPLTRDEICRLHPHVVLRHVVSKNIDFRQRLDLVWVACIAEGFDIMYERVDGLYADGISVDATATTFTDTEVTEKLSWGHLLMFVCAAAAYRVNSLCQWEALGEDAVSPSPPTTEKGENGWVEEKPSAPVVNTLLEGEMRTAAVVVPSNMSMLPLSQDGGDWCRGVAAEIPNPVVSFLWDFVPPVGDALPYAPLKITWLELLIKNVYLLLSFSTLWVSVGEDFDSGLRSGWGRYMRLVALSANGAVGANMVDTAIAYFVWHLYGYFQDGLRIRRRLGLPSLSTTHLYATGEGESLRRMIPLLMIVPSIVFAIAILPWMLTHWVPAAIIFFPFFLVLLFAFVLVQAVLLRLFQACHGTENIRQRWTSKALIFACTFLMRGCAALFLMLLIQAPVNWMLLEYRQDAFVSSTTYSDIVVSEYDRRSALCFFFNGIVSATSSLPAILTVV